jgi:CBS domain-containing protein
VLVRRRTEPTMRVQDVMTAQLISVAESASLWDALSLMVERKVSALIVFDGIGVPVGVLSEGDLMRRAEFGAEKRRPRWLDFLIGGRSSRDFARSHGRRVHEVMTRGIHSVEANAEVSEAVDLMLEHRVRRLMVVNGAEPVGVISRSDLVRALMRALPPEDLTRSDADIQAAIEEALAGQPWAPIASIRVVVEAGVATLEGAIAENSLREGLRVLVENTPGVKSVRDRLAWIEPNSGYLVDAPGES